MTVSFHNNVFVDADQPFRLVPYSTDHEGVMVHWFEIKGCSRLAIFANKDHPEAHRLPAAVAAFNAVMDGEVTPPAIPKPTLQQMHTDLLVSFDHPRFVGIPHETKEALALWVVHALRPGSCTVALLEHDLARAEQHAHPLTRPHLPAIVEWISKYVPAEAKGARGLKLWQGYSRW